MSAMPDGFSDFGDEMIIADSLDFDTPPPEGYERGGDEGCVFRPIARPCEFRTTRQRMKECCGPVSILFCARDRVFTSYSQCNECMKEIV